MMSDDLVRRLRGGINGMRITVLGNVQHGEACLEAADRIEALIAERDRFAERHERHLILGAEVRTRAEKAEAERDAAVARAKKEPDYCYNPEDWEYTQPWDARHELAESVLDYGRAGEPVRISTLISGPDKWVARVQLDTDGDGEADDWEYQWFDSEDAARTMLKTKG